MFNGGREQSLKKKVKAKKDDDLCGVRVVHLQRVKNARKGAIDEKELERLSLLYKALGDPNRLRIAHALKGGEMCVCDLAAFLGVGESAVSHQLRLLRSLALVKARREGQMVFYSLDDEHVEELIEVGLEHARE